MSTSFSKMTAQEIHRRFRRDAVVAGWRRKPAGTTPEAIFDGTWQGTHEFLLEIACQAEAEHKNRLKEISTEAGAKKYAVKVRRLIRSLSGISDFYRANAPLSHRILSGYCTKTYRLEKIILETLPGLHATANLYLPADIPPPYPGILYFCGHSLNGKAHDQYRLRCINLAMKGFAVLIHDPLGQGERDEYVDISDGRRTVPRACRMHGAVGDPMYLSGLSLVSLRLHDARRCLDYMQSRSDVISSKIGVAGSSGGGWESLWLAAIDKRVKAVVSSKV